MRQLRELPRTSALRFGFPTDACDAPLAGSLSQHVPGLSDGQHPHSFRSGLHRHAHTAAAARDDRGLRSVIAGGRTTAAAATRGRTAGRAVTPTVRDRFSTRRSCSPRSVTMGEPALVHAVLGPFLKPAPDRRSIGSVRTGRAQFRRPTRVAAADVVRSRLVRDGAPRSSRAADTRTRTASRSAADRQCQLPRIPSREAHSCRRFHKPRGLVAGRSSCG